MTSRPDNTEIILNFLPVELSSLLAPGYVLPYEDQQQFGNIRQQFGSKYLILRDRNAIQAVPLDADRAMLPNAELETFDLATNHFLAKRLIEDSIRRVLLHKYQHRLKIPLHGKIIFKMDSPEADLFNEALSNHASTRNRLSFLHIYRRYHFNAEYLQVDGNEAPKYGVLISISTGWQISATVSELLSSGVNVQGCYVLPTNKASPDGEIGDRVLGKIRTVKSDVQVQLADFRESEYVDPRKCYIEASLENVVRCIEDIVKDSGTKTRILASVRQQIGRELSAERQQDRIRKIAGPLSGSVLPVSDGISMSVGMELFSATQSKACRVTRLAEPQYKLKYSSAPVTGDIAPQLARQGPFDQDNFHNVAPAFLVLAPKSQRGRVEQYLRLWMEGEQSERPRYRGVRSQYRLRGGTFWFEDVSETGNVTDNYRGAISNALAHMRDAIKRFSLAFVIVREDHRLMGRDDPYLVVKSALMGQGIPVQALELETIAQPETSQPYILNNIGLACYAKLGGTPWALASARGQGITHELIIGLGSTIVSENRLQEKETYVGITTVFNYDGVYLLSNVSKEAAFSNYSDALQSVLHSNIKTVAIRDAWQRGDRVRLVFHTSKPLRNLEIEAVKRLVSESLAEYTVEFAFLVIGRNSGWTAF